MICVRHRAHIKTVRKSGVARAAAMEKTSGRGHKGDKARGSSKVGFEGGQTPLHRRLPKQRGVGTGLKSRGFNSGFWKTHYAWVNLSDLERFDTGTIVTPELLVERRIIKDLKEGLKVLANGGFSKSLTVYAAKFSGNAAERIRELGGQAIVIGSELPATESSESEADTDPSEA